MTGEFWREVMDALEPAEKDWTQHELTDVLVLPNGDRCTIATALDLREDYLLTGNCYAAVGSDGLLHRIDPDQTRKVD